MPWFTKGVKGLDEENEEDSDTQNKNRDIYNKTC